MHNVYLMFAFLGLDAGDRKALDAKFKPTDAPPCQFDKEDLRFVLKGKDIILRLTSTTFEDMSLIIVCLLNVCINMCWISYWCTTILLTPIYTH